MSITLSNGVVLPDIPSDYLGVLPFCTIYKFNDADSSNIEGVQNYVALLTPDKQLYVPPEFDGESIVCLATGYSQLVTGTVEDLTTPDWTSKEESFNRSVWIDINETSNNTYELIWSNHDILKITGVDENNTPITDGTVYFLSSVEPPEPFILPDGTELPPLPAGCFEEYPYGILVKNTDEDGISYSLYLSNTPQLYADKALSGQSFGEECHVLQTPGYKIYRYYPGQSLGWLITNDAPEGIEMFLLGSYNSSLQELVWSNHDVLVAVSKNADGTFVPGSDIYFHSSLTVQETYYRIPAAWLHSIARHARRLGNTTGALTPSQMLEIYTTKASEVSSE